MGGRVVEKLTFPNFSEWTLNPKIIENTWLDIKHRTWLFLSKRSRDSLSDGKETKEIVFPMCSECMVCWLHAYCHGQICRGNCSKSALLVFYHPCKGASWDLCWPLLLHQHAIERLERKPESTEICVNQRVILMHFRQCCSLASCFSAARTIWSCFYFNFLIVHVRNDGFLMQSLCPSGLQWHIPTLSDTTVPRKNMTGKLEVSSNGKSR